MRYGALAFGAACIERAGGERSPRTRVHEQEPPPHRNVACGERGTVEEQRLAGLGQRRAHLIHDATAHADMMVLGAERDARDLARREPSVREQAQRLGESDRQGRRRREPRPYRHVARDRDPGAGARGRGPGRDELVHHARDIGPPPPGASRPVVDARHLAVERRDHLEDARLATPDRDDGALGNRHREHGTAVVVGVFAQQVDPAGRRGRSLGGDAERPAEQR